MASMLPGFFAVGLVKTGTIYVYRYALLLTCLVSTFNSLLDMILVHKRK